MTRVLLQLDYYMSAQFAGVALALKHGLYNDAGLDVTVLPLCPPGQEPAAILAAQALNPQAVCVGSIEQNVLVPYTMQHGADGLVACAAMFGRSPLCLAALPNAKSHPGFIVGAHEDTVELLRRLLPKASVVCVERADKLALLRSGALDAVQIYDCMENQTLASELATGDVLTVVPFEAYDEDAALGYAQVLFSTDNTLQCQREPLRRFLNATFEGWRLAITTPAVAAAAVLELQPHGVDHFVPTTEFTTEAVRRCCEYVKRTSAGEMLGVIDPHHWEEANAWLSAGVVSPRGGTADDGGSVDGRWPRLDRSLWAADPRLMLGSRLAARILPATRKLASEAQAKLGRRPRLVVVTLGSLPLGGTHVEATERLELIGVADGSWFCKPSAGAAAGVQVEEMWLPHDASTESVAALLRLLVLEQGDDIDGIQLMWPLPPHVDAAHVTAQIPLHLDVDGCHYLGLMNCAGGACAVANGGHGNGRDLLHNAPVTASAVIRLLDAHGVAISGRRCVVVGRSKLCGAPIGFMLNARGGLVTTAYSQTTRDELRRVCLSAEILVVCAGVPGLIEGTMVAQGAVVINVGTTLVDGKLVPDIPADLVELAHARLIASCPNGIGPLSLSVLLHQTAASAVRRVPKPLGAEPTTPTLSPAAIDAWLSSHRQWKLAPRRLVGPNGGGTPLPPPLEVLSQSFHFASYPSATSFAARLTEDAERTNHHPNLSIVHSCTEGVDVTVEYFTYAVKGLTRFDTEAAERAQQIYESHTLRAMTATTERLMAGGQGVLQPVAAGVESRARL